MADTAVALTTLTANTVSTALATAGTSVATGNVAVIAAGGNTRGLTLAFYGSAASTATVATGVEPPSESSGIGAGSAQTIASGSAYVMQITAGRFVQANGTVRITIGGTGPVIVTAFTSPQSN